jgi:hypothetical protein
MGAFFYIYLMKHIERFDAFGDHERVDERIKLKELLVAAGISLGAIIPAAYMSKLTSDKKAVDSSQQSADINKLRAFLDAPVSERDRQMGDEEVSRMKEDFIRFIQKSDTVHNKKWIIDSVRNLKVVFVLNDDFVIPGMEARGFYTNLDWYGSSVDKKGLPLKMIVLAKDTTAVWNKSPMTFYHELAHYLDNLLGMRQGSTFLSDSFMEKCMDKKLDFNTGYPVEKLMRIGMTKQEATKWAKTFGEAKGYYAQPTEMFARWMVFKQIIRTDKGNDFRYYYDKGGFRSVVKVVYDLKWENYDNILALYMFLDESKVPEMMGKY